MEAAMRLTGTALRLTVFVGENDTWHHKPLYAEIVHRAHRAGLAGASVFRGIEGFGVSSLVHTSRLLSLGEDLPVAVIIIDTEERVRSFLPQLDELITEGLVTLDDCDVIRYTARGDDPRGDDAGGDGDTGSGGSSGGSGGSGSGSGSGSGEKR
jgi:PII-like signaling protein